MRCPYCSSLENKVVDSRMGKEGESIRRRRECLKCEGRFTTYERVEEVLPSVIKKDGRREPFDRLKILNGLKKACEKRPISMEMLERTVEEIEKVLQEKGLKEIPSTMVGEEVMERLHKLDEVAYVRFASVYRSFRDINEFMSELKDILSNKDKEMKDVKDVVTEKPQKAEEKKQKPEKLLLPLDS
jgi:transcriptional repressor NrdR